jgi:hypothetical protein
LNPYYLPENPASAVTLSLPSADAPILTAESLLDALVFELPHAARLMPEMTPDTPISLFSTQKLWDSTYTWDPTGMRSHRFEGQSTSGRSFFSIAMPDDSLILGQLNPKSGMVNLFPFALTAQSEITVETISAEFDVWENLSKAAPVLHLNYQEPPEVPHRKVPTWLTATLMGEEDHVRMRAFCEVGIKTFLARHSDVPEVAGASMHVNSRYVDRQGNLSDLNVSLCLDGPHGLLKDEEHAFCEEAKQILNGAGSPVPTWRQVSHRAGRKRNPGELGDILGSNIIDREYVSAHDSIEASALWAEMRALSAA